MEPKWTPEGPVGSYKKVKNETTGEEFNLKILDYDEVTGEITAQVDSPGSRSHGMKLGMRPTGPAKGPTQ